MYLGTVLCCGPAGEATPQPTDNTYYVELDAIVEDVATAPIVLTPSSRKAIIVGEQYPDSFAIGETVTQLLESGETASGVVIAIDLDAGDHANDRLTVMESPTRFEVSDVAIEGASGSVVPTEIRRKVVLVTNISENLDASHTLWPGQYVQVRRVCDVKGKVRWIIEA